MTRQIIIHLSFSFLFLFVSCMAQNTTFDKIEYASFNTNSQKSKQKDSLVIEIYSHIDKAGIVTVVNNDTYHDTITFYTYKLTAEQLQNIQSIFNINKKLTNSMITTSLAKNSLYAGNYDFFRVSYKNGEKKDSLCFIEPFMSQEFNFAYKMLNDIYYSKMNSNECKPFVIPKSFRESVLLTYKKSKYLPKVESLSDYIQ
jgi:hypothetical protein